jgi:hypothetical protein
VLQRFSSVFLFYFNALPCTLVLFARWVQHLAGSVGNHWWPRAESNHRHADFQSLRIGIELGCLALKAAVVIHIKQYFTIFRH